MDYDKKRAELRMIFAEYHTRDENDPWRRWSEKVIRIHENYCRNMRDELLIHRHNTFVMKYLLGYSTRVTAKRQNAVPRMVYRELNDVLDDLMVIVWGIDGIRQRPQVPAGGE